MGQEWVPCQTCPSDSSRLNFDTCRGLGGDTDTSACVAGAIAEAFYGEVPPEIVKEVRWHLDTPLLEVVDRFAERYRSAVR